MTFAAWYSAHVEPTLPATLPDLARKAARDAMAACWNAALQAADVQTERILRQATEPQDPPITDLASWVAYYRMLIKNSHHLIEAK
jgi:hypothetical protein